MCNRFHQFWNRYVRFFIDVTDLSNIKIFPPLYTIIITICVLLKKPLAGGNWLQ